MGGVESSQYEGPLIEEPPQMPDPIMSEKREMSRPRWLIADITSPNFGKEFKDKRAIEKGVSQGSHCLIVKDNVPVLLQLTSATTAEFTQEFYRRAKPQFQQLNQGRGVLKLESEPRRAISASAGDHGLTRSSSRAELGHWDIVDMRPPFILQRILFGVALFCVYSYFVLFQYKDTPPSIIVPLLVTFLFPAILLLAIRIMHSRPAEGRYVFELLLAFDFYQLTTSAVVLILILAEAQHLGMLAPFRAPVPGAPAPEGIWGRLLAWVSSAHIVPTWGNPPEVAKLCPPIYLHRSHMQIRIATTDHLNDFCRR
jgi:hypothetical protein